MVSKKIKCFSMPVAFKYTKKYRSIGIKLDLTNKYNLDIIKELHSIYDKLDEDLPLKYDIKVLDSGVFTGPRYVSINIKGPIENSHFKKGDNLCGFLVLKDYEFDDTKGISITCGPLISKPLKFEESDYIVIEDEDSDKDPLDYDLSFRDDEFD